MDYQCVRFVISDKMIKEQIILGKDFIVNHNVSISAKHISINGSDNSFCKVVKNVMIPANSEMVIQASTSNVLKMYRTVVFEPIETFNKDLFIPRSIDETKDNSLSILIQNHSSKPIELIENTVIGQVEEISVKKATAITAINQNTNTNKQRKQKFFALHFLKFLNQSK